MATFFFVRHGQSQANADKIIAKDDTPLTELGLQQAIQTGLKAKEHNIKVIACSPLLRAQQTAETIAAELEIDLSHIKIIDELAERGLGDMKGNPKEHESHYYYVVENEHHVESREDTTKRMKICLQKIKQVAENGTVLVVGHAVSGYYLIEVAAGRQHFDEFDPPEEIMNADIVEVSL